MPISDYKPTPADIGALARQRTVDDGGNEIGTFNETTRPTGDQVDALISDAMDEVYPYFGGNIPDAKGDDPDAIRKAARSAVKYRAASLVELTYFGKEVARGNSPYKEYLDSFKSLMESVKESIDSVGGGDDPIGDDQSPIFDFPSADGLVGWSTWW